MSGCSDIVVSYNKRASSLELPPSSGIVPRRRVATWLGSIERLPRHRNRFGPGSTDSAAIQRMACPAVIRINPRDYSISPALGVGILGGALEVLQRLDSALSCAA
jgi:hypothetical protein